MRLYPVIMCGGAGSRLWPTSRPSRPKQFLSFVGDETLFRQTVDRVCGVEGFQKLIVVAGKGHFDFIKDQVSHISEVVLLLEPQGRDSAPAIAAATAWIDQHDPQGVAAIFASDHYIPDVDIFRTAIHQAAFAADAGRIVTLGIVPSIATSAYGYIAPGQRLFDHDNVASDVCDVTAFVEKPDIETAQKYIEQGYLWNSGNFVFAARTMKDELNKFVPEIWERVSQGIENGETIEGGMVLGEDFLKAPKISIDYAVMEKTTCTAVLPVDLTWSDVGAWDAVMAQGTKDAQGNVVLGDNFLIDTQNSYIRADDSMLVAMIGVQDLVVVAEEDAVLICDVHQTQKVKMVVDHLKAEGKPQLDKLSQNKVTQNGTANSLGAVLETIESTTAHKGFDHPQAIHQITAAYKQWLFTDALPLWWTLGADHQGWGFYEYLERDGTPTKMARRMRVQARQVYVFAKAGEMGWRGPWRAAVEHGLKGLYKYYKTNDGRFKTLVDVTGNGLDENILLYDQAFIILALSAVRNINPDAQQQALALLSCIEEKMRHKAGGFVEAGERKFQSNPHMHLFEAALAWVESGQGDPRWRALADEIAQLALTHFIDQNGFIREFFQEDWQPAKGEVGQIVEPGHQFEWAWLLERYYNISQDPMILAAAKRLFEAGEQSVDRTRNVALDRFYAVAADGGDHSAGAKLQWQAATQNARLWPQTERLKAALTLGDISSPEGFKAGVDKSSGTSVPSTIINGSISLARYLDMDVNGLWQDNLLADNTFLQEPVTASSLYHIITAVEQLMKTAKN